MRLHQNPVKSRGFMMRHGEIFQNFRETRNWFFLKDDDRIARVNRKISKGPREYSRMEEMSHTLSHGAGFLGALVGFPFLMDSALRHGGRAALIGAIVFWVTAALLYLASTIYHALPPGGAKERCEIIDHAAIYLLIAGTYTPFTLLALRGTTGWTMFVLVWAIALVGVVLKSIHGVRYPKLSVTLYVGMGWLIIFVIRPLMANLPTTGLLWLAGGGIAYTLGVVFYVNKRLPFGHFVWHLFVLMGTSCHYIAVIYAM